MSVQGVRPIECIVRPTLCRQECVKAGSEYYLAIDSVAMVTNPDMIQHLLKINKYVNTTVITS